ncbi:hypothetical protein C0J52_17382, partial [Blattella germanica]
ARPTSDLSRDDCNSLSKIFHACKAIAWQKHVTIATQIGDIFHNHQIIFCGGVLSQESTETDQEPPMNIRTEINNIDIDMLRRASSNMVKKATMCLQEEGGHFQHLLQLSSFLPVITSHSHLGMLSIII